MGNNWSICQPIERLSHISLNIPILKLDNAYTSLDPNFQYQKMSCWKKLFGVADLHQWDDSLCRTVYVKFIQLYS